MSGEQPVYLDASALVKLVVREAESPALEAWLGRRDVVSCALARTEVVRAVALRGRDGVARARRLLDRVDLIQLDDELLDLAAELDAPLRSLDAIHIAAALELGDGLEALVTYDAQMRSSAEAHGLPVVSPS
jgi:predicted nucleic acid-binding protein